MRLGLIVNPVAGLGGAVGLKGTDGPDTVAQALRRGAVAQAGPRTRRALEAAAREIVAGMEPGVLYLIGPGTSAGLVTRALGLEPTILGVDALRDRGRVARDATAAELERLAGNGPVRLVLGVTGQQGFLIGRGNQQISVALLARAGHDGLIVLATEAKLAALAQPMPWIDTGDAAPEAIAVGIEAQDKLAAEGLETARAAGIEIIEPDLRPFMEAARRSWDVILTDQPEAADYLARFKEFMAR